MAQRDSRVPGNAPGAFYVDRECIDCDLCRETAPENFERNEEEGYSFVAKQPENDEEETLCREALENCPVEAIGDDGPVSPVADRSAPGDRRCAGGAPPGDASQGPETAASEAGGA